jgi:hypothetical protein
MRIIFGKETCAVCGKPAEFLLCSKPKGTPGYFSTQWFCKEHFHGVATMLKEADEFNQQSEHQ